MEYSEILTTEIDFGNGTQLKKNRGYLFKLTVNTHWDSGKSSTFKYNQPKGEKGPLYE